MVAQCAPLQGIALMLALVLFASSLSAAAAFREGFYGGYYYELVATCSENDVYIRTSCENRSYTAKASADIYRYRVGERYTTMGPESAKSSISLESTFSFSPVFIISYHHINGILIDSLHIDGN